MGRRHNHYHIRMDELAYGSLLREWNVLYKIFFTVCSILFIVGSNSFLLPFVSSLFFLVLCFFRGKMKGRDYISYMKIPLTFVILSGVSILFEFGSNGQTIWKSEIFGTSIAITGYSMKQAISCTCNAIGAFTSLYFLAATTPMGEILSGLKKFHVPDIILELMHLIYRFLFIILDTNQKQKEAMKSRMGYYGFWNSLHTFGAELANLLIVSLKKSFQYQDAMDARGYSGSGLWWDEKRVITREQILYGTLYIGIVILTLVLEGQLK